MNNLSKVTTDKCMAETRTINRKSNTLPQYQLLAMSVHCDDIKKTKLQQDQDSYLPASSMPGGTKSATVSITSRSAAQIQQLTQNFTRKNADCGPLSNSSRKPPVLSGNLSAICRISTDCNHTMAVKSVSTSNQKYLLLPNVLTLENGYYHFIKLGLIRADRHESVSATRQPANGSH